MDLRLNATRRSINLSVYLVFDLEAARFRFLGENLLGAVRESKNMFQVQWLIATLIFYLQSKLKKKLYVGSFWTRKSLNSNRKKRKTLWLYARQPSKVLPDRLNARQSEMFTEFQLKGSAEHLVHEDLVRLPGITVVSLTAEIAPRCMRKLKIPGIGKR